MAAVALATHLICGSASIITTLNPALASAAPIIAQNVVLPAGGRAAEGGIYSGSGDRQRRAVAFWGERCLPQRIS